MNLKMRAAIYCGVRDISIVEREVPVPAEDEVLLKVHACAICGTDVRIYHHGNDRIKPPIVLGHEVAGSIAAMGKSVRGFQVGDRVILGPGVACGWCRPCRSGNSNLCLNKRAFGYEYDGGFSEYMLIPAEAVARGNLIRLPESVSWEEGALAEPLSCCINGQKNIEMGSGHVVAIYGAGPIGLLHLQLARRCGARVGIIDVAPERLVLADKFKPDFVVDASRVDPVQEILGATDQHGADVGIICCSAKQALEQVLKCTCRGGRVLLFAGLPKTDSLISLDANFVHYREVAILGAFGSTVDQMNRAVSYIADGSVDVRSLVTATVSLEELMDGIQMVRNHQGLKVVVKP